MGTEIKMSGYGCIVTLMGLILLIVSIGVIIVENLGWKTFACIYGGFAVAIGILICYSGFRAQKISEVDDE